MHETWPRLPPLDAWSDTLQTLHLWTQIVGKIRLTLTPWTNHSWHVPLYVSASGLRTSPLYESGRALEIAFDLLDHRLRIETSGGERSSFELEPMSVAEFYRRVTRTLAELGFDIHIWPMPVEIPDPIQPLDIDREHAAYDPEPVTRFFHALCQAHRLLTVFRARFVGKASPVHFFWGAFDLAVTRFSGRTAPIHPGGIPNCADWIMEEAYSHELSSAGFWPGTGFGEPAFYAYAYPEPEGFRSFPVEPEEAQYYEPLGEYLLPYEAVRTAPNPDRAVLEFLQSSYEAEATLARWDRPHLERSRPALEHPVHHERP